MIENVAVVLNNKMSRVREGVWVQTHQPEPEKESHLCLANSFFIFFFQLSQNSELERQQRIEAAHWSECVREDQSEACINPMCQSGKNQAQLGSRTVELPGGGVCDAPTAYEREAGTRWSFEEGPADTFYSQSVSRHFQRWEARDFVACVSDVIRWG